MPASTRTATAVQVLRRDLSTGYATTIPLAVAASQVAGFFSRAGHVRGYERRLLAWEEFVANGCAYKRK